eukprot:TRINITY_DN4125_c0_g1_i1.p1 TRINITY_DN4125_c0_g1~~TRINITY_DN4125_c0_g1_i1.p1  ORF type:complete len:563 (-),score=111.83 TRINITY_DN4125_c0_g1_i1:401-1894(-)
MKEQYLKDGEGFLILYSVTDRYSFERIDHILSEVHSLGSETQSIVIVGNKIDLVDDRVVSYEEGYQLAAQYGYKFLEASAKDRINNEEMFYEVVRGIMRTRNVKPVEPIEKLSMGTKIKNMFGFSKENCIWSKPVGGVAPVAPEIVVPDFDISNCLRDAFLNRDRFGDVSIVCWDEEVKAHAIIVCSRCKCLREPVLDALDNDGRIDMKEYRSADMIIILEYLYTGTVESIENIDYSVLYSTVLLAKKMELNGFLLLCVDLIEDLEIGDNTEVPVFSNVFKCALTRGNRFSKATSDLIIDLDGMEIYCHKVMLYYTSTYFQNMITPDDNRIELHLENDNCSSNDFETMIRVFYTGSIDYITETNALPLISLAKQYQSSYLGNLCEYYLSTKITNENIFELLEIGSLEEEPSMLYLKCIHYLVINIDDIFSNFPVFKDVHARLKKDIGKLGMAYIDYLKSKDSYWNTHASLYMKPSGSHWKRLLKKYNRLPENGQLKC